MNLIPFQFQSTNIQVITDEDGQPWLIAKEVAEVLGYSDAFEMTKKLDDDEKKNLQIAGFGPRGVTVISESGLYSSVLTSNKPDARPFKRWVTQDVIPTVRKTGAYGTPNQQPTAIPATKEFTGLFRVARMLGLDKNSAAISANQGTAKITGTNLLVLMNLTHLTAESQDTLWYTPTELGRQIGVSARSFNMLLADAGLQARKSEVWDPLPAAEGFFRLYDTGKKHGSGVPIQQLKWSDGVLPLVRPEKEAA